MSESRRQAFNDARSFLRGLTRPLPRGLVYWNANDEVLVIQWNSRVHAVALFLCGDGIVDVCVADDTGRTFLTAPTKCMATDGPPADFEADLQKVVECRRRFRAFAAMDAAA